MSSQVVWRLKCVARLRCEVPPHAIVAGLLLLGGIHHLNELAKSNTSLLVS